MRIFLVDNNTKHLQELINLCKESGADVTVRRFSEINVDEANQHDLIVLSGGSDMAVDKHQAELAKEKNLITQTTKPIIGICLGFEVLADTFGGEMYRTDEAESGVFPLSYQGREYKVFMAHKWHLKDLGKALSPLATSKTGIQIFRHKDKPIFGFQFHPEVVEPENSGKEIFLETVKALA